MSSTPGLQQVSQSLSVERNEVAPATAVSLERRDRDLKVVREEVLRLNGGQGLPVDMHLRFAPFNICLSQAFANHVRRLHKLLDRALIDVVDRWCTDEKAQISKRMPIEKHEEDLLKWMSGPGRKLVPPFRERYGMWRTDYLVEKGPNGTEQAKICEINSRIPFNALWLMGFHEGATSLLRPDDKMFKCNNDFKATKEAVLHCFNQSEPLYHIRDKWPGVDSHPMSRDYPQKFGKPMITVKPSQLRLEVDSESATGHSLFVVPEHTKNGEHGLSRGPKQKVKQCSLELFQEEYQMEPLVLQQIATCCVNDLRNVLLIHDKRILGIVEEELPDLEARGVLTAAEAGELSNGIADTLLAGSDRLKELLQKSKEDDTVKNAYIIKPVRDALGNDIRLAKHLSQQEWLELLEQHCVRPLRPSEGAFVIQRLAEHIWYDILRHNEDSTGPEKFHLIGSHHLINSFDVFGVFRIGEETHVGVRDGDRGIVMSTILRPENVPESREKEV